MNNKHENTFMKTVFNNNFDTSEISHEFFNVNTILSIIKRSMEELAKKSYAKRI